MKRQKNVLSIVLIFIGVLFIISSLAIVRTYILEVELPKEIVEEKVESMEVVLTKDNSLLIPSRESAEEPRLDEELLALLERYPDLCEEYTAVEEEPRRRVWHVILPKGAGIERINNDNVELLGQGDVYGFNSIILGIPINENDIDDRYMASIEILYQPQPMPLPSNEEDYQGSGDFASSPVGIKPTVTVGDFIHSCANLEEAVLKWYPIPLPDPNGKYDYVILIDKLPLPTTKENIELYAMLQAFMLLKKTNLVTVYGNYLEDTNVYTLDRDVALLDLDMIKEGMDKTNAPEEIHSFLKKKYPTWGFKYLLIIGNQKEIPSALLYSSKNAKPALSDVFYTYLGDWDIDKDGQKGELDDDGQSTLNPHIHVGRIPFNDPEKIKVAIGTIVVYYEMHLVEKVMQKLTKVIKDGDILSNEQIKAFSKSIGVIKKFGGSASPRCLFAGGVCNIYGIMQGNNEIIGKLNAADYLDWIETGIWLRAYDYDINNCVRLYQKSKYANYYNINPLLTYSSFYTQPIEELSLPNLEDFWNQVKPDHVILMGIGSPSSICYTDLMKMWDGYSQWSYKQKQPEEFFNINSVNNLPSVFKKFIGLPIVQLWAFSTLKETATDNIGQVLLGEGVAPTILGLTDSPQYPVTDYNYNSLFRFAYYFNSELLLAEPPTGYNLFKSIGEILAETRKSHVNKSTQIPEEIWMVNLYGDPETPPYRYIEKPEYSI